MGLDTVELIVIFEKQFFIDIPNAMAEQITTVGDCQWVVWQLVQQKQENMYTRETAAAMVAAIIASHAGLELHQVTPEKNLASDLGLD